MENPQPRFLSLAAKTVVCHTITYMFMGILAAHFLNYAESMARPDSGMRHMDDPLVMAGGCSSRCGGWCSRRCSICCGVVCSEKRMAGF